jgi:F0F1-type ATP synthase membrane subunit c/vacuolar-type H+-ATPase subunit K
MSQEKKKMLVIGIVSSRFKLAEGLLGANLAEMIFKNEEYTTKVAIVGLVGAGIFIAGLVVGITGFMKKG